MLWLSAAGHSLTLSRQYLQPAETVQDQEVLLVSLQGKRAILH